MFNLRNPIVPFFLLLIAVLPSKQVRSRYLLFMLWLIVMLVLSQVANGFGMRPYGIQFAFLDTIKWEIGFCGSLYITMLCIRFAGWRELEKKSSV